MTVNYRRNMGRSYMVLNLSETGIAGYEFGMIKNNRIEGILPLKIKSMNGETLLYYDITGKQSMSQVYRKQQIRNRDLEKIFQGIQTVFRQAECYMLKWEGLVLDPEYIYIDRSDGNAAFCYLPGRTAQGKTDTEKRKQSTGERKPDTEDLEQNAPEKEPEMLWPGETAGESGADRGEKLLAEFILKHLDHNDEEAVAKGYLFYQRIMEGKETIPGILGRLEKEESREEFPQAFSARSEAVSERPERRDERREKASGRPEYWDEKREKASGRPENWDEKREKASGRPEYWDEKRDNTSGRPERRDVSTGEVPGRPEHRDEKSKETPGRPERRKVRKEEKVRISGKKPISEAAKKEHRQYLYFGAICLAAAGLNVFLDLFFAFDLTQVGGLAFGSAAVLWLVYRIWIEARREQKNPWEDILAQMEDTEENYLYEEDSEEEAQGSGETGEKGFQEKFFRELPEEKTEFYEEEDATRILAGGTQERGCLLISEAAQIRPIRLQEGQWTIGKSAAQSDISISSPAVSRVHARADVKKNYLSLTDLNSRNGTYINGRQIEPYQEVQLQMGDRVRLADMGYIVAEML